MLLYISADFVNALTEEKQGIVRKFIDTLKSIVESIKNYLKNGDVNHRIAAQLALDVEALEQYEKLWVDALKAAVKNNAKMQSNTKENTDSKKSFPENIDTKAESRYNKNKRLLDLMEPIRISSDEYWRLS